MTDAYARTQYLPSERSGVLYSQLMTQIHSVEALQGRERGGAVKNEVVVLKRVS
jgi:hypothetical protein